MMEELTTVPASIISATSETIDRSRPVSGSANSAPEKATGRIIMTMTGMRKDSNWDASTNYTSPSATMSASNRSPKFSIMLV